MKKFLSLLLVLVLCLSMVLTSCKKNETPEPDKDPATTDEPSTPDVPQKSGKEIIVDEIGKAVTAANTTVNLEALIDAIAEQGETAGTVESLLALLPEKLGVSMKNDGVSSLPGFFAVYKDGDVIGFDMGGDELTYFVIAGNCLLIPAAGAVKEGGSALAVQPIADMFGSMMSTDSSSPLETLKETLKGMGLTEITLNLPKLEESMLTESEGGYYIVSNTYVEACLKAVLDAIPEEVLTNYPAAAQGIAAVKTMMGGLLTNLGLKVELHTASDKINGVKLSVNSNKDFAALAQLTPSDKIAATVEILTDATGEKLEKFAVDITLAGDTFGNGTFSLLLNETDFRFQANYVGKTEIGGYSIGNDETYTWKCIAYADQTVVIDIALDLTALEKADATVIRTFSVLTKTENITFVRVVDGEEVAIDEKTVDNASVANWIRQTKDDTEYALLTLTSEIKAEGQVSITVSLQESENEPAGTATVLLYCNTLPEFFKGLDEDTANLVAVYKANAEKIEAAMDAFGAYIDSEMDKTEPDEVIGFPFVYAITEDTALMLYCDTGDGSINVLFFEGTTDDMPDAVVITAISEDGKLTFTVPGGPETDEDWTDGVK